MNKAIFVRVVIWLLVIFTGIAFGAGAYEARVEIPQWLTVDGGAQVWHAQTAAAADPGFRFWAFVTTGPLTLLTVISLFAVWKTTGPIKKWWLVVLGLLLVDRSLTFGYFIPTMVELMSGTVAQAEAVQTAQQWANLNIVRLTAAGLAFLASIKLLAVWSAARNK
jgi:hypothetical protein